MKKAVLVLIIILLVASSASAEGIGFIFRPRAAAILSVNNYFRGGAIGGQVLYDLFGFLGIGLEAYVEYDTLFNVGQMPINLVLGKDFFIVVGTVVPFGTLTFNGVTGSAMEYVYGSFPNNFGLGVNFPIFGGDGPFSIDFFSEITYTLNSPAESLGEVVDMFANLMAFFMGLKAYAGIGVTLRI
jgi:hypothetical protein